MKWWCEELTLSCSVTLCVSDDSSLDCIFSISVSICNMLHQCQLHSTYDTSLRPLTHAAETGSTTSMPIRRQSTLVVMHRKSGAEIWRRVYAYGANLWSKCQGPYIAATVYWTRHCWFHASNSSWKSTFWYSKWSLQDQVSTFPFSHLTTLMLFQLTNRHTKLSVQAVQLS